MPSKKTPASTVRQLAERAEQVIEGSFARVLNRPQHSREEDFVSDIVSPNTTHALANVWRPLFQNMGMRVNLHGVFCHGRPRVRYSDGQRGITVELADLLIAHVHLDANGSAEGRAMLLQAKMGTPVLGLGDEQLGLYSCLPEFTFVDRPYFSAPRKFDVRHSSAKYATIYSGSRSWDCPSKWAVCQPTYVLSADKCLSDVLAQMIVGEAGGKFSPDGGPLPRDLISGPFGWSFTVHELLKVTATAHYRLKSSGISSCPRGAVAFLQDHGFISPYLGTDYSGRCEELGISTLLMITGDERLPYENYFVDG